METKHDDDVLRPLAIPSRRVSAGSRKNRRGLIVQGNLTRTAVLPRHAGVRRMMALEEETR